MKIVDLFSRRRTVTKFRQQLSAPPKVVESAWRAPRASLMTDREKFLSTRSHRRKAVNRTRAAVAKQSRKVNR